MIFKNLNTKKEVDLIEYVRDYVSRFPETEILIGCDSQNHKHFTTYAVVIALYKPKKGANVLFHKTEEKYEKIRPIRLMNEVWKSIEIAELLIKNNIIKAKYIDIDINPDKRYKSNEVLRSAVGLVEGMGYQVRYKSLGALVTYAADTLVK